MEGFVDISFVFKRNCGVYILYQDDEIVYVGQSRNVIHRVNQHKRTTKFYITKVLVLWCDEDDLDTIEGRYIRLLKPRFNKVQRNFNEMPFTIKPEQLIQLLTTTTVMALPNHPTAEPSIRRI